VQVQKKSKVFKVWVFVAFMLTMAVALACAFMLFAECIMVAVYGQREFDPYATIVFVVGAIMAIFSARKLFLQWYHIHLQVTTIE